ncbi:MAG: TIGR02678 family protein [Thermincolia bacterium]
MSRHDQRLKEERQQCARALLNRPWITKEEDPEVFQAVKSHYDALRDWFQEYCGFTLLVTRQFVKLEKIPGRPRPWMGFGSLQQPRDYALFSYCLWYLEGKGETDQFLLTEMVEEIREHLLSQDVLVDWTIYDHRLSMARALKLLKELGVLATVDGDEWEWAKSGTAENNVLYEATPWSRYVLRRFPKDLAGYGDISSLGEGVYPDTSEGQLKRRKHRIYRRLLQEPVVYDWEWTEEEKYYVLTQRRSILDQLENMFGLEGQRYREGLVFFHPELTGEAMLFPTARGITDLALLLGGEVRRMMAAGHGSVYLDDRGRVQLTWVDLEGIILRLREKCQEYWSKKYRQATARELAAQLMDHLEEWGLGGREDGQVLWIYPGLARWNGDYSSIDEAIL